MTDEITCDKCKQKKERKAFSVHEDKIKEQACMCKNVCICDACFGKSLANGCKQCLYCGEMVIRPDYTSSKYVNYDDKDAMIPLYYRWILQLLLWFSNGIENVWSRLRRVNTDPDIVRQLNEENILKKQE